MQRYIKENNLNFIKEYVDDGVSGTTFNRPRFNEMLQDIKNGTINMVITKDLSRLGRDYIKTGYYIEEYFPKNNIRYVSITDGIDTYIDNVNNDITPFKAIMNDMYARDISKKIRSVYKEKQRRGEYICSVAPYGYKRNSKYKNKLIVDEKVRDIVGNIFNMYVNGHGTTEIAKYLNDNYYLSPLGYRKTGILQYKNNTQFRWNEVTLCNILKNEVYIGNTVQNKTSVVSYKVKKIKKIEKKNQIRVNNTHEPIVDKDIFEKVQCIIEKRGTNAKPKYDYLFRGLIYCKHCKRKLQIVLKKNSKSRANSHPYITCSNAKTKGCYPLNMNYEKFEKYIINILKKIIIKYSNKEIFYFEYEKLKNKNKKIIENNKNKLIKINEKINEINNNLDKMYIDKLRGILQEKDYIRIYGNLDLERNKLNNQKKDLENTLINKKTEKKVIKNKKEINKKIENFLKLEKIDKIYLYRLINKIEIDKDKNIYIYFNFSKENLEVKSLDEFIEIEQLLNEQSLRV